MTLKIQNCVRLCVYRQKVKVAMRSLVMIVAQWQTSNVTPCVCYLWPNFLRSIHRADEFSTKEKQSVVLPRDKARAITLPEVHVSCLQTSSVWVCFCSKLGCRALLFYVYFLFGESTKDRNWCCCGWDKIFSTGDEWWRVRMTTPSLVCVYVPRYLAVNRNSMQHSDTHI